MPFEQAKAKLAVSVPFAGEVPKECVPFLVPDSPFSRIPVEVRTYASEAFVAVAGITQGRGVHVAIPSTMAHVSVAEAGSRMRPATLPVVLETGKFPVTLGTFAESAPATCTYGFTRTRHAGAVSVASIAPTRR